MATGEELLRAKMVGGRSRPLRRKALLPRAIVLPVALLESVAPGYAGYQRFVPSAAPVVPAARALD